MGALAWVEILDRRGHVRTGTGSSRCRPSSGGATGATCWWMILVSPIHVRIYRTSTAPSRSRTQGAKMGSVPRAEERVTLVPLGRGVMLRAGQTLFRILPRTFPSPPPSRCTSPPLRGGWEQWWSAGGGDRGGRHFRVHPVPRRRLDSRPPRRWSGRRSCSSSGSCWRGLGAGDPRSLAPGSLPEPFRHRSLAALAMTGVLHTWSTRIHRPGSPTRSRHHPPQLRRRHHDAVRHLTIATSFPDSASRRSAPPSSSG